MTDPARSPQAYLQLTGTSFSGTTLLAFLLNAHEHMTSLGEMEPIARVDKEQYNCSCGRPFLTCPFNVALEAQAQRYAPQFSLRDWRTRFAPTTNRYANKVLTGSLWRSEFERARDVLFGSVGPLRDDVEDRLLRIEAVARAATDLTGATVYVDSTKNPRRIAYLADHPGVDLKALHVVKDVRQGVASLIKRERGDAREMAKVWKRANLSAARAVKTLPAAQTMVLRYDDLASDAQGTVDRISAFVGVPTSQVPDDFFSTEHHVIGNRMRLNPGSGAIRVDESWRDRLTADDLAAIAEVAGDTNRAFGFSWPD